MHLKDCEKSAKSASWVKLCHRGDTEFQFIIDVTKDTYIDTWWNEIIVNRSFWKCLQGWDRLNKIPFTMKLRQTITRFLILAFFSPAASTFTYQHQDQWWRRSVVHFSLWTIIITSILLQNLYLSSHVVGLTGGNIGIIILLSTNFFLVPLCFLPWHFNHRLN